MTCSGLGRWLALLALVATLSPAGALGASAGDGSEHRAASWSLDGSRLLYSAYGQPSKLGVPSLGVGVLVLAPGAAAASTRFEATSSILDARLERVAYADTSGLRVEALDGSATLRLPPSVQGDTWLPHGEPFSPDGTRLLLRQPSRLVALELASGQLSTVASGVEGTDTLVVWSTDGLRISLRTSVSGRLVWRLAGVDGVDLGEVPEGTIALSPDLTRAVASSERAGARLVDLRAGTETPLGAPLSSASWSRDGSHALLARERSVTVVGADGSRVRIDGAGGALSPDGALLARTIDDEVVVLSARRPFSVRARFRVGNSPGDVVWSPDGSRIATSGVVMPPCLPGILVLDLASGAVHQLTNDCRVVGTEGDDVMRVAVPAIVLGLGGDDTIVLEEQGWSLVGSTVEAGPGDDVVISESRSFDRVVGGAGDDVLRGGAQDDIVLGGSGDDRLDGGAGHDLVAGGPGNDHVRGGPDVVRKVQRDNDRVEGGSGRDALLGGARSDLLIGDAGEDRLVGGSGLDVLDGGPDGDELRARDAEFDCLLRVEPIDLLVDDARLDLLDRFPADSLALVRCRRSAPAAR